MSNYLFNMKSIFFTCFFITALMCNAQSTILGIIHSSDSTVISKGTVALFAKIDTSLIKVETTDENGKFKIDNVEDGNYFLKSVYFFTVIYIYIYIICKFEFKKWNLFNCFRKYISIVF